jgi:hypothetical protein
MILGAMLLFSPLSLGLWTYAAATIWALVGGATILGSAVYDHFYSSPQSQEKPQTGIMNKWRKTK